MNRRIYLLNPKHLSPETIAVTFAKTSRSPQSFEEIAAELSDEQSAQFHEKWVVGYGHASVAEHAVLHVALENISRLAVETVEANRLASYTEKSTRYQKWAPGSYHIPAEFTEDRLRKIFTSACDKLFDAYQQTLPLVRAAVEKHIPCREGESDAAWDRRIRSVYVDVCRFLLPAASLANVGLTANARVLEYAVIKMLSHPLEEVRAIGRELKETARAEVPTLVKYAEHSAYIEGLETEPLRIGDEPRKAAKFRGDWCSLAEYDPHGEERVLTSALYRVGDMSYEETYNYVCQANPEEKQRLAQSLLGGLGEHDTPARELEHTGYTFDLLLDQGGYFELKRHRMMTQTPQLLTTANGFATPRLMAEAGCLELYQEAMNSAAEAYETLAEVNRHAAGYVVPNGYLRRVLLTLNLRSAFHLCSLRSAQNAHFSMRRAALRLAEEIRKVHPLLGAYLRTTGTDWRQVEEENFVN